MTTSTINTPPSTTTTHTPGPWHTDAAGNIFGHNVGPKAGKRVAVCDHAGSLHVHSANARLIAAAPELLAALQSIAAHAGTDWDYATTGNVARAAIARAAIARATGGQQ